MLGSNTINKVLKTTRRLGFVLLAAVFLAPIPLGAQSNSVQSSEADYQRRLKALKTQMGSLGKELNRAKGDRGELQGELQAAEQSIGKLNRALTQTKKDQNSQTRKLVQLRSQRTSLRSDKKAQEAHISEQIRAAYKLGQQGNIKLLLNQEAPEDVSRILRYYDYFLEARAEKLDAYRHTLHELDLLEPKIEDESQALEKTKRALLRQRTALNTSQDERQATLARLSKSIKSKDAKLKTLNEDQNRLQQLLQKVATAIANLPVKGASVRKKLGALTLPVSGKIAQSFGAPRADGKMRWNGLLITAAEGSDVSAIHHGQVVFSDYLKSYGLLLIVDHGNGYMSLYAHNQSLLRDTGDWIEAGEVIAAVGNSGGQSRTGLYFELRHKGKPINPVNWFKAG